jgi:acetyltransferase-like isoleucine patch superfamily enzyme
MMVTKILTRLFTSLLRLRGAQIGPKTAISYKTDIPRCSNIRIGARSTIYKGASIYLGQQGIFAMGNRSHLAPFAYLLIDNNGLYLGDNVAVGPFCGFFCHSNAFADPNIPFCDTYLDGDIVLGSNIFIGAQCIILPHTKIEDNVIIGANSLVKGTLVSGYMYAGSPAKKIKELV